MKKVITRNDIIQHITQEYNAAPEYLWTRTPNTAIFRHAHNRKWFAAIIDVKKSKMGLTGDDIIDIVNVKCDSELIGALLGGTGYKPAYHMNKSSWISIILDENANIDEIFNLINLSYKLTK